MEYNYEIIMNLISFLIMILASIIITHFYRTNRKDLKLWVPGYWVQTLDYLFLLVVYSGLISVDPYLSFLISGVALLLLLRATWGEYKRINENILFTAKDASKSSIKMGKIAGVFLIFKVDVNVIPIITVLPILALLIYASFLLYKVYMVKRTPTHLFLMITLLVGSGVAFSSLLLSFGIEFFKPATDTFNVLLAMSLLTVSLTIIVEDRLIEKSDSLNKAKEIAENTLSANLEISNQLNELVKQLTSNTDNISASSENIASSQQQISHGAMNQVVAINEAQVKFSKLIEGVSKIRQKINEITNITDLIQNISNQTNMLALNAAIEAARAGEAGRGFNVVADQVRKLAVESKNAAIKTENMLDEIEKVTHDQEESSVEMEDLINRIASVAEETSASTEESAAAAEEQSTSMQEITLVSQIILEHANKLLEER